MCALYPPRSSSNLPVRSDDDDGNSTFYDYDARQWVKVVFPSLKPSGSRHTRLHSVNSLSPPALVRLALTTGRQSVLQLERWLDKQEAEALQSNAIEKPPVDATDALAMAAYMAKSHDASIGVLRKVPRSTGGFSTPYAHPRLH